MLNSPQVRSAFDLAHAGDAERERYGRHTYGQGCLLARRLVEAGVRLVTVYFSPNIGGSSTTSGGWDTHANNGKKMFPIITQYHLPYTDRTLPTLIEDLDDRGLLDETLVIWMGEFGRTPEITPTDGRNHWPNNFCAVLGGGGVKTGQVIGETDETGYNRDSNRQNTLKDPVSPQDLYATIGKLLSWDTSKEFEAGARPVWLVDKTAKPVEKVFA